MYGTIASATVTVPIVMASRCGFVTRISIRPGSNDTRRMSSSSAGGGFDPTRSTMEPPAVAKSDTAPTRSRIGSSAQSCQPRRVPVAAPASIYSSTSKKPIQPSSANSDWCAWNMKRPGFGNSSSRIPRCPWQSITVSVYSK